MCLLETQIEWSRAIGIKRTSGGHPEKGGNGVLWGKEDKYRVFVGGEL